MRWKKIIILCLLSMVCLVWADPIQVWGATGTVDVRVAGSDDDSEEYAGNANHTNSVELDLDKNTQVGLQFKNIAIPQGVTITNAYIEFTCRNAKNSNTDLTIWGEAHDSPGDFSGADSGGNVSTRTKTGSSVNWDSVAQWNAEDNKYQTPDISTIVQEIVSRGDGGNPGNWASGNHMVFIIQGTNNGARSAHSYDGDAANAPLLHVEYTSTVIDVSVSSQNDDAEEENDSDVLLSGVDLDMFDNNVEKVGIRFQNVQVPRGMIITSAYIQFEADESHSAAASMKINGEASDSASEFAATDDDITNRTKTGQYVEWNSIPSWTAGNSYQTPDLSAIVQEIIGRSGWASGNNLAFIIAKGSGTRVAESYDGDGTVPLLHIEYSDDSVPYITVDHNSIGASAYVGSNPSSATFTITNSGSASMTYTLADDADAGGTDWLSVSPASGTIAAGASASVTVSFATSALSEGTYSANITITDATAPNSPVDISVSVVLSPLPAGSSCGNVPVYTENLVSPAILILLDNSGSMDDYMPVSDTATDPKTPDLSTIVQEIVDRDAWVSGNAMSFIITGSGERVAVSYDQAAGASPLLHVEYTSAGTDGTIDMRVSQSSDDAEEATGGATSFTGIDLGMFQTGYNNVGIRFRNVTIPPGATINSAYLQFVMDETDSAATTLNIYGEDLDNPSTFAANSNNISGRTKTTATVVWDVSSSPALGAWTAVTQKKLIDIGKDVISSLVTDRSISWGFGSWNSSSSSGYTADIDYTKIHVGSEYHDSAHQTALQAALTALPVPLSYAPLAPSLHAADEYFLGNKADQEGSGDMFATSVDCQPKFMITVTPGLGLTNTDLTSVSTNTTALLNNDVTPLAVGFGIDDATQIEKIAEISNQLGGASADDDIFDLHVESGGVGQPFLANNEQELVDALSTITESIKDVIFYGAAPTPTTSADLGDSVLIAKFDASDWSGDLEAVTQADDGDWDVVEWAASSEMPLSRSVFTISPGTSTVVEYTDALLAGDNWLCKPIGDIINSTPAVVGTPPFHYTFDSYETWKDTVSRDAMVYIGANDGALHAFDLATGVEKWAFVPENLQAKLMLATGDSAYDMCDDEYCHQYFVDGSPKAADIYDTAGPAWKSILVVGEREGGEAYFALDVTSGEAFDAGTPSTFLWEFTDTELGQTWNDPSIKRVLDSSATAAWAVFFGSGYSASDQANKESYLYGIVAQDKSALWNDGTSDINRIKIFEKAYLAYDNITSDFSVGETITGLVSDATATIVAIDKELLADEGILVFDSVTGGPFVDNETIKRNGGGEALVKGTITDSLKNDVLASPLVVDFTGDDIYDQIYAGNLYGTMYRIADIGKGENPSVSKLFDFDPVLTSPDVHPIRAQADYAYGDGYIWVLFGTGKYESQADKTNMQQQYFFGIQDSSGSTTEKNVSDLVALEAKYVTDAVSGEVFRYIDGTNPSNLSWVISLDNTSSGMTGSERVIAKPLVVGNIVFFSTFIPDQNVCAGNGDSYVFALDLTTGQAPDSPVFDVNEDGVIDEDDVVTDAAGDNFNVAGIRVGDGQASNPVLFKTTLFVNTTGGGLAGIDVSLSDNRVQIKSWTQK